MLLKDKLKECLEELHRAKTNYNTEIEKKQQKIQMLENEVHSLKTDYINKLSIERNVSLCDNDIYKRFKVLAIPSKNIVQPSTKDWNELMKQMEDNYPLFFKKICKVNLTQFEFRVCVLTRLSFSNSEMMIVLESSPSSISNAKQKINVKLFGGKGATSLLNNMLNI